MIIDAHVHYTPPALQAWLAKQGDKEPYWDLLLNSPQSIQGWATAETMIAHMDTAGIDKVVLVGEYWQQHTSCVRRNDQVLGLMAQFPERIMAMAIVQPTAGDAALREAERCLDAGMIGLGELNPYAQNFALDDPRFSALVTLCETRNAPINLHVGEEIGGYYLGKSTTPLRHYYDLVCRFPAVKWVLAHWGGGLLFYEMMPKVRRQLKHVWYDTAASPLLYPTKRIFETALSCVDPAKIIYGSDYPLRLYPRKMTGPDFVPFLQAIRKQKLANEADILGRNFINMLAYVPEKQNVTSNMPDMGGTVAGMIAADPRNAAVFAQHRLPTRDSALPTWEPVRQAAAARGFGRAAQDDLLDALYFEDEQ